MTKKTYIVFYEYFNKLTSGIGFLTKIKVERDKGEDLDIFSLNNFIEKKVIKNNKMDSNTKVVITNIINSKEI